jgi:drug/metabolite transporter (DMT)-like permease
MNRKFAIGLLVGANVLWGSSYVVAKIALEELPPPLLGALRFSLTTLFIWLVVLWQSPRGSKQDLRRMDRADALKLVGLGLCGISLSYLLSYSGISLTTATDAALMIICEVIFTSLLAVFLIGEQLGRWKGIGIIIGIIGVVIVILNNATTAVSNSAGLARAMGDILIMGGLFCQAIYSVLGMGLARKYQPLTILAFTHLGSLLVWLPLLLWYLLSGRFPALSFTAIAGVIYLAAVISLLCFLIWFSVLRVVGANLGAVSLFTQPVVGALLGVALLGDPVTLGLSIGAVLIFVALYLTAIPDRPSAAIQESLPG